MNIDSDSYKAGRLAYREGHFYSEEPSLLNFSVNLEEWKAGFIDAIIQDVRRLNNANNR